MSGPDQPAGTGSMQTEPVAHVDESMNMTSGSTIESLPVPESPRGWPEPASAPESPPEPLPEPLPDSPPPSTVTSGPTTSPPVAPSAGTAQVAVSAHSFEPQPM